jgi:DNA-directed RNA polymerase subunit RPC12/RpoP
MICLSCNKQIPDDSVRCPECGAEVFHKEQVKKEIGFRRLQRWFFYALLSILFLGMTGVIIKIYKDNSDLLVKMASSQKTISVQTDELQLVRDELDAKVAQLAKIQKDLEQNKKDLSGNLTEEGMELNKKINEISSSAEEKISAIARLERINSAFLNIAESAAGISNEDLERIPVASTWPLSLDTDKDGLPDDAEKALGTNALDFDTDADGYSDGAELVGGFNPLGQGLMPIDESFADKQKGKIFRQSWGGGYLWYVGQDGKRYFLSPIEDIEKNTVINPVDQNASSTASIATTTSAMIPVVDPVVDPVVAPIVATSSSGVINNPALSSADNALLTGAEVPITGSNVVLP